jgi:hypothetical protein
MKNASAMFAVLAAVGLTSTTSDARPWRQQPRDLAIDYSQIIDNRSLEEVVVIWWLIPQLVGDAAPAAAEMLDDYVIIGVVHGHVLSGGSMSFDDVPALTASDAGGVPLTPLRDDDMPPAMTGALAGIRASVRQSLGQMGQGMHFFAFEAQTVHACSQGGLAVPFADETYTYDTPIPGCEPE